jgi:hypothetical protein
MIRVRETRFMRVFVFCMAHAAPREMRNPFPQHLHNVWQVNDES